ncbi:MAG: VWA domain-containing protein [Polyangiales bacterium]
MATPASLQSFVVHRALSPAQSVTTHALFRVKAAAVADGPRPALSVTLVVDTSGSMSGEPIAQVIDSARKIATLLEARDALAVVSFSSGAGTVSPPRRLTDDARAQVRAEVSALDAGGNTNMSGGIAHAALLAAPEGDARQVMIVLSDGQPNLGTSTPTGLAAEVRRVRDRGVSVSTLGYGAHHNDDVMVAVADAGGGRYAFVADPKLAAGSFARALGAQRDVVLEGAALVLAPAEGVEIRRVLGDPETSFGAGGLRVKLPDLAAGDEVNVLVELRVTAPMRHGPWAAVEARLVGKVPVTREGFAQDVPAVCEVGPEAGELDATALVAAAVAQADEARAKARALADKRNFAGAAALLRDARRALTELPNYRKGSDDPLDDAVEALTDDIANMEKVPDQEEYQKLRKASRDFGSLMQGSTKMTSVPLGRQTSSMHEYQQQMTGGAVLPEAYLLIASGPGAGQRYRLGAETDIGRGASATVRVDDHNASRIHTRVVFNLGGFWAVDCGSTNGTFVNGRKVERAPLVAGSTLQVGEVTFVFEG